MSWWRKLMFNLFARRGDPAPVSHLIEESRALHEQVKDALDKNRKVQMETIVRSLDQIESSAYAIKAVNSTMKRVEQDPTLRTAEEAWRLVSPKGPMDEEYH